MKFFTKQATFGWVIFGLMLFGSVTTPSLVRAEGLLEAPIETSVESPDMTDEEPMTDMLPEPPMGDIVEIPETGLPPAITEPEATFPEVTEVPEAAMPPVTEPEAAEPQPQKPNKGLKLLFGILQLLGQELAN